MQSNWKKQSNICFRKELILFMIGIFLSSCVSKKEVYKPLFNPKPPEVINEDIKTPPGSLYSGYDNLFSDDKAFRVGDTITIKVVENVSGQGSAATKTGRDSSVSFDFPSPKILGKDLVKNTPIAGIDQRSRSSFNGTGDTKRNANLVATITARVVKVYPNGNLFVVGKKVIRINNDVQILRISGIVKPTYIQQDNSVNSSRISDMYVEYNGKGFMADNQDPGWLAKFLTKIWPF
ncbi:MAG: flagellar basal body L-ring protein FlgH [Aquificota bacterium]|nr:MAG: flagellar basal body L-ring protein FlgH [Aquificota bacterium]